MRLGRTLVLAVDGFEDRDADLLRDGLLAASHPLLSRILFRGSQELRIRPGGPAEPAPALASLLTGASVAHTGVPTQIPFCPSDPATSGVWYASALRVPTLLDEVAARGAVTGALQWPATAGAEVDLCLPLVEDLRHYRDRWTMAESTSSARMVNAHLRPRREAGVHLSQVPPDALVAQVAVEMYDASQVDLLTVQLSGLGAARRTHGPDSPPARRALVDVADALEQIVAACSPTAEDRLVLVPGRRLVPTGLLVHPNAVLARHGLVDTEGTRLTGFRALVWPDGPHGALHVRHEAGEEVREAAVAALEELVDLARRSGEDRLHLRRVDDGVGATAETDVVAVLDGIAGTLLGLPATHRPLVEGDDPYYAEPRAVSDPSAPATALGVGPGLPDGITEGSWADLGVTLAQAMGTTLSGATAPGMQPTALPA